MPNKIYKHLELTGTSNTSIEEAVQNALARASKTVRNIRWMHITETRGQVDGGKVVQWQVTLKAGFALEE
jgi:flavin-binding protein dodecin